MDIKWSSIMTEDDKLTKIKLQKLLSDNVVEVQFTKKNGDYRVMRCTLDPTYLPLEPFENQLERDRKYTQNEDVLPVWDVGKSGWRSFRIDSIHGYLTVNNKG